ncbi:MAG: septal ring lytic transglycosylase RlpA family protein [Aestuariivirga sp.]
MRRTFVYTVIACVAVGLLAGCSSKKSSKQSKLDPFAGVGSPYYKGKGPIPVGGGRRHVGKPYQVAGRWFTPKEQPGYDKEGPASWYGEAFHRRMTSNGEYFDMNQLTAAHPTLPIPSYAKVTNLANGQQVIVRINDRGPFVGPRIIDLSKRVAEVLDFKRKGKTPVRVQYIGPAPLNDRDASHLIAMNRELERGTPLRRMIAAADGRSFGEPTVAVAERQKPRPIPQETQIAEYDSGVYFVQVGSFAEPANAMMVQGQLESIGPVQVTELLSDDGAIFRVRVGPIGDEEQAQQALAAVIDRGHADAHLVASHPQQAGLQ